MKLQAKKIIHLPVFTQSGKELGRISDFEVEEESQKVIRYYVKSHHLIAELFAKELIVNVSQVISITKEKMIVEDLDLKEKEEIFSKNQIAKNKAAPPISLSKTLK